ncbi:hypothetical protein IF2G_05979 [Cordyceps javanica]|nr:hypothetical protein IF2G_05979 [Cordyceps javanica]
MLIVGMCIDGQLATLGLVPATRPFSHSATTQHCAAKSFEPWSWQCTKYLPSLAISQPVRYSRVPHSNESLAARQQATCKPTYIARCEPAYALGVACCFKCSIPSWPAAKILVCVRPTFVGGWIAVPIITVQRGWLPVQDAVMHGGIDEQGGYMPLLPLVHEPFRSYW